MLPTDPAHRRPHTPSPTAFGTTSDQFARALRNAALFDLNADLHASDRVTETTPGAVVLDGWLAALERCTADLVRADRFAPDDPAPAALIARLERRLAG